MRLLLKIIAQSMVVVVWLLGLTSVLLCKIFCLSFQTLFPNNSRFFQYKQCTRSSNYMSSTTTSIDTTGRGSFFNLCISGSSISFHASSNSSQLQLVTLGRLCNQSNLCTLRQNQVKVHFSARSAASICIHTIIICFSQSQYQTQKFYTGLITVLCFRYWKFQISSSRRYTFTSLALHLLLNSVCQQSSSVDKFYSIDHALARNQCHMSRIRVFLR